MPPCKHVDICGLDGEFNKDAQLYCALHLPAETNDHFIRRLSRYLTEGKTDFRYFHFPRNFPDNYFEEKTFSSIVDMRDVVLYGGISFRKANLQKGLKLSTESIAAFSAENIVCTGPFELNFGLMPGVIGLNNGTFSDEISITGRETRMIILNGATVTGRIKIKIEKIAETLNFRAKQIGAITVEALTINSVTFLSALVTGHVNITVITANDFGLERAKFHKGLSLNIRHVGEVNFEDSESSQMIKLCAAVERACRFDSATMQAGLDLRQSEFRGELSFGKTIFGPGATLDLSHCVINGPLTVMASPKGPAIIKLDRCVIHENTHIEGELGEPEICVIAKEDRPRLHRAGTFVNADLSECRLVGNSFDRMTFDNVKWASRHGRSILYDEKLLRSGTRLSIGKIKEAYQILKEKYRRLGDNHRAGDFHYGEMEMRRRENGKLRQRLSAEALYWTLSGYGVGYVRAGLLLLFFICIFAAAYCLWGGYTLEAKVSDSLLFSLQVSLFQRPAFPEGFTIVGRWLQVGQSILIPVQAALFVLAVRMRFKR